MKDLFLLLAASTLSPVIALADGNNDWHMGDWRHMMWFGYGGMFMWIIFLVLIGVVVYFILKSTGSKASQGTLKETPMDILKRRYANGEISRDKFEKMKSDIGD